MTREEQKVLTEEAARGSGPSSGEKPPLSRHTSAAHYADAGKVKRRHSRIKHVLIGVAVAAVALVVAAVAYLGSVNAKLNNGISPELVGALTGTREPDKPFYMLLLGTDRDEERADSSDFGSSDSAYRSDSIILARLDPQNKKVALVSIHRDTRVDMGQYGHQKINAAYALGGASYATEVISKFAGVDISHYAEADMDGLSAVVDEVGGIDVDLPMDVKDPKYTGLDLKAGQQHLDGKTAALLCRSRHAYDRYGDGDRYRAANQRIVIEAVLNKVLASDPITMVSTVQTLASHVRTDMTVQQIVTLAGEFSGMNTQTDITTGINPTTSEYIDGISYEISDDEEWEKMMQRVDQGLSPTESGTDDETAGVTAEVDEDAESSDGSNGGSSS